MQETTHIHIGQLILKKLKEEERSIAWLARQTHCEYSNFCKILKKQFIDSELLLRISLVLKYDFFSHFSQFIAENTTKCGK